MHNKIIFISGGVMSGIGKGIIVSSIAVLLQHCGLRINTIKLDPYLNVDAGTMNPFEHGETFVTEDGLEADLDLGHYERFTGQATNKDNIITAGKIYQSILDHERSGKFLGQTVQMIPHVSRELMAFILKNYMNYDATICEIGGTVGDIESMLFMEVIRQVRCQLGTENVINIFLTYVPYLEVTQEFKTKPSQHAIKTLLQTGIAPDIVLCRYEKELCSPPTFKEKIGLFSNLPLHRIFLAPNVENIYELPFFYAEQGLCKELLSCLQLHEKCSLDAKPIMYLHNVFQNLHDDVHINIVMKYGYKDAFISLAEALKHAAFYYRRKLVCHWIDVRTMSTKELRSKLSNHPNAILVPGGFGEQGVDNKIEAIRFARENNVPFLGICYGMQLMCVEYARNVLGHVGANTEEITSNNNEIVHIIDPEQQDLGGTMRLGSYDCLIQEGTMAHKIYGKCLIRERHRHRYEINHEFIDDLKQSGLVFSGTSPDERYMEIAEVTHSSFHMGVQFHPEFQSSIFHPHPLFKAFLSHAIKYNH